MTPSFNGLVYLFGTFSMGFLTYRFFMRWERERDPLSFNFLNFGIVLAGFALITAIGGIFFPSNLFFLKIVVILSTFLEGLACAFLGRVFVYLKLPKISPWFGFFFIFLLGVVATVLTIIYPFTPRLEDNNWINWDLQPLPGIFRVIYYFFGFLPIGVLMLKEGIFSKEKETKIKSLGLGLIFISVLLWGPLIFIFRNYLPETLGEDFIVLPVFLMVFILTLLTQKAPSPKYVTKV